jgi:MFS family permease
VLFVQPGDVARDAVKPPRAAPLRVTAGLLALPRYRSLLVAGGALSLATASDAFIFLVLQEKLHFDNALFPLLFVGSSATFMLLATPFGRLADRVGPGRVLLAGYGLLLVVYALLVAPLGGWQLVIVSLALLGAYYAATDGVLMALGSSIVPAEMRGSGLALLRTVTSGGRLLASLSFGALWTLWGIDVAIACFGAAMVVAGTLAAVLLMRGPQPADAHP